MNETHCDVQEMYGEVQVQPSFLEMFCCCVDVDSDGFVWTCVYGMQKSFSLSLVEVIRVFACRQVVFRGSHHAAFF